LVEIPYAVREFLYLTTNVIHSHCFFMMDLQDIVGDAETSTKIAYSIKKYIV